METMRAMSLDDSHESTRGDGRDLAEYLHI